MKKTNPTRKKSKEAIEDITPPQPIYSSPPADLLKEALSPNLIKSRRQGREIAMQSLYQKDWGQLTPDEAIELVWLERPAGDTAKHFASLLIKGTLEHQEEIDVLIKKHSEHWKFDRIPRVELAILRFSIYSLLYIPEIPPIVTIDEAIEISKIYSGEDAWRYINGMLDSIYSEIKLNIK